MRTGRNANFLDLRIAECLEDRGDVIPYRRFRQIKNAANRFITFGRIISDEHVDLTIGQA
jgi:hypothetical protein